MVLISLRPRRIYMGKTKLFLKTKNKELQTDIEYLLASTGYFDFVGKEEEGVCIIDLKADSILGKSFSDFLGEIIEGTNGAVKKDEKIPEGGVKSIAVAALSGNGWSKATSVLLGRFLFKKGYRVAYLSLSPINTWIAEVNNNDKGFVRWLIDRRNNCVGEIEKYAYDDGEIIFIGAPAFNPNAGDVREEDMRFLCNKLLGGEIDFLIIDIGVNLDLEREKIFLAADFPVLGLSGDKCHEAILHKFFEGSLPIYASGKSIERDAKELSELIERRLRYEADDG